MKGVIAAVFVLVAGGGAFAADWATVVRPAAKLIPRLEIQRDGVDTPGVCSGIVINTDKGYVLTAAHCVPTGTAETFSITVNGRHAVAVKVNRILDVAVLKFSRRGEVAAILAPETPSAGTEVCVMGFGFGIAKLAVQFGRISQPLNDETHKLWINVDTLFGDSGGGIIDEQGRIVAMTSQIYSAGPAHISLAVPVETLRDFADEYLPKP